MSDPTVSPVVALDVYFNSKGKHSPYALEIPRLDEARGFFVPWEDKTAKAYRSWRSEWSVLDSDRSTQQGLWEPGLRVLEVEATKKVPGYSPVSRETLAVSFWDLAAKPQPQTDDTEVTYWIEFVTMYYPMPGVLGYVEPNSVLPSYWGLDGQKYAMPVGTKEDPNGAICAVVNQTGSPISLNTSSKSLAQYDSTLVNSILVNFAEFKKTLYTSGAIRIFISVFAEIRHSDGTALHFYDDPEMDVNVP